MDAITNGPNTSRAARISDVATPRLGTRDAQIGKGDSSGCENADEGLEAGPRRAQHITRLRLVSARSKIVRGLRASRPCGTRVAGASERERRNFRTRGVVGVRHEFQVCAQARCREAASGFDHERRRREKPRFRVPEDPIVGIRGGSCYSIRAGRNALCGSADGDDGQRVSGTRSGSEDSIGGLE